MAGRRAVNRRSTSSRCKCACSRQWARYFGAKRDQARTGEGGELRHCTCNDTDTQIQVARNRQPASITPLRATTFFDHSSGSSGYRDMNLSKPTVLNPNLIFTEFSGHVSASNSRNENLITILRRMAQFIPDFHNTDSEVPRPQRAVLARCFPIQ